MTTPDEPPPSRSATTQQCPRCHALVSIDATFCPRCGEDLRPRSRHTGAWVALAAVLALLIGGGIAYALTRSTNGSKSTSSQSVTTTKSATSSSKTVLTRTASPRPQAQRVPDTGRSPPLRLSGSGN